jgi:hypothetical protein
MLSNDELKAFKELRFVLECQDIRLRQLGSKKPRVFHGPGRIFQEADGQLHFEAYVNKAGLELPQSGALGERLPKSRYYSLRATDWRDVFGSVRRYILQGAAISQVVSA